MRDTQTLLALTVDIVAATVANNSVTAGELPSLITSVHAALLKLGREPEALPVSSKPEGAVTVRKSLADRDTIISMIDGKSYSSLKRHLNRHGYTPASYREAFNLKSDYPMVAPGYSERRRDIAKTLGLGRKKTASVVVAAPAAEFVVKKVRKPRKASAQ